MDDRIGFRTIETRGTKILLNGREVFCRGVSIHEEMPYGMSGRAFSAEHARILLGWAKEMGCNKIAYAHHRDDVIETMMMSLFYEGRFHSFSPLTYLDRMDLTVIRPMIFVTEADVIGFRNKYQLPVCKNPCPMDGYTKRQYIKELIHRLQEDNPHIKDCMFRAILDGSIKGWPQALK